MMVHVARRSVPGNRHTLVVPPPLEVVASPTLPPWAPQDAEVRRQRTLAAEHARREAARAAATAAAAARQEAERLRLLQRRADLDADWQARSAGDAPRGGGGPTGRQ